MRASKTSPTDAIQTWTHETGATVYLVEKHDFPYVTFDITLRTGALRDPEGKAGLANYTASLMMRGAGDRDRAAVDTALDNLGADIEVTTTHTSMSYEGDGLSRTIGDVFDIMADVVQRPSFSEVEFEKLRREMESDILRIRDSDRKLNRRFFHSYLFGAHPYGRPVEGTLEALSTIASKDVKDFYKAHVRAQNLIVGFSGDITKDQANALVAQLAGDLPSDAPATYAATELPALTGRQVLLIDKPERTQNQILIGHHAPDAMSKDQYALEVANTIFGGTFTARLNHEVRDQRGLSYGAYSYLNADRVAGSFSLWTFPAQQDGVKTVKLLIELYEGLQKTPLTAEEVDFAKRYLVNAFAFRIDTPAQIVAEAIRADLEGRPADYLGRYAANIDAVTVEDVNRAVAVHLDPDNFLLAMLCSAAGFEEPMRALPGVTTVKVVPYDQPF